VSLGSIRWRAAGPAAIALVALGAYVAVAPHLGDLGRSAADLGLYAAVPLILAGAATLALHPVAGRPPSAALALLVIALPPALALALVDVEPLATPLRLVVACGAGFWLAGLLEAPWQLAVVAGVATIVDIVSVAAGPTNELVDNAPGAVDVIALHLPAWGSSADILIGLTDFLFLACFVGGAIALGLRVRATLVAVVVGLEVSVIAAALLDRGLPGLPFMSVALLAVNWDLMFGARRGQAPSG
jgi:hypothetical protein